MAKFWQVKASKGSLNTVLGQHESKGAAEVALLRSNLGNYWTRTWVEPSEVDYHHWTYRELMQQIWFNDIDEMPHGRLIHSSDHCDLAVVRYDSNTLHVFETEEATDPEGNVIEGVTRPKYLYTVQYQFTMPESKV